MALPELALQQPLWLLLWPLGLLAAWWSKRRHGRPPRLYRPTELFGLRAGWRHPAAGALDLRDDDATRSRPAWWPLLAYSCLLLALAQPVRLGDPLPAPRPPVDLYVLFDTSVSMVLRDYRDTAQGLDAPPITRLDFAKGLLDGLAADYSGDRLALYLVGSPSRRLLPPTPDIALFRHTLAQVPAVLAGRRAELGDALARLAADLAGRSRERQAIALLVSDGTQPSGNLTPEAGAERLRQAGVPLYVLAVGAGGATEHGPGGLLFGSARPGRLEDLAKLGGGLGVPATDAQALQAMLHTLSERHLAHGGPAPSRREPLYPWLLLAGLLALGLPLTAGRASP